MSKHRPNKDEYYLGIAEAVSRRSTCLRRQYGAVIVNHDQIISTGYVGAPRGALNCIDIAECPRQKANIPKGERYELCRSVHAEMNAIIHAARSDTAGGTLYLVGIERDGGNYVDCAEPCKLCKRMIINSGIALVIARQGADRIVATEVKQWIAAENIDLRSPSAHGY